MFDIKASSAAIGGKCTEEKREEKFVQVRQKSARPDSMGLWQSHSTKAALKKAVSDFC